MSPEAALEVLDVEPLPDAVLPGDDDEPGSRLVILDAVITPSVDTPWRGDLRARAVGADAGAPPLGHCVRLEIFTGGGFATRAKATRPWTGEGRLEPPVLPAGPQRLRITLRCHADARRLCLWLGTSSLGVIELPIAGRAGRAGEAGAPTDDLVGAASEGPSDR